MGRYSGKTCRLLTMFVLTTAFFLLEVVYGYMSNSVTLIADSFHMLSDVLALVIAFVCMKFSKRTRSSRNTFGWVRAEVLGALVNTVFLIALSFSIILEAIQRFFQYEYIHDPVNVLIVGAAGFALNIVGLFLFHGHGGHEHSHGHRFTRHCHFPGRQRQEHGDEHNSNSAPESDSSSSDDYSDNFPQGQETLAEQGLNKNANTQNGAGNAKSPPADSGQMNMRGVFLHVLGDAFGSIVVIVNAVVNWRVDSEFLRRYLDPMLSLVISGIIICTSIPLLKESALVLLQTVPSHIDVDKIERKLLSQFKGRILSVHDFHVWRLAGNKVVATAHMSCRAGSDSYMRLAEKLKEFFHDEGIHSTTLQLEMVEFDWISGHHCALRCPRKLNADCRPCTTDVCCVVPPTPAIQTIAPGHFGIVRCDKPGLYPSPSPHISSYSPRSSYI